MDRLIRVGELDPKALEAAARAIYVWHHSESSACRYWDHGVGFDKSPWLAQAEAAVRAYLTAVEKASPSREPSP